MKPTRPSGTWKRSSRVLLVDSDAETRALLAFALRADGNELMLRTLGVDIYECIRRADGGRPPDVVVIVDRGADASLEQMSALCRSASIPVLVITAFKATDAEPAWASRVGVVCLGKPLDTDRLQASVRRLAGVETPAAPLATSERSSYG
jgi:DNA-binding response OmpR family regulator